MPLQSISADALKKKLESEDVLLIDVREANEHEAYNIGGRLLPMNEVLAAQHSIPKNEPVIFYCQKGIRSAIVIQRLQDKFGFSNLWNLAGGIEAWKKAVEQAG